MFTQGLLVYVYDGSEPGFWYNDGLGWMKILRSGDAKWSGSPDISYTGGKVGIGTSGPSSSLDVEFWNSLSDGIDINNSGTGDQSIQVCAAVKQKQQPSVAGYFQRQ